MGFIGFMFIFILICSWVISLNGTNPYGFHIDCLGWKVNILMKSMSMGNWNGNQTCWFPSLSAILSLKNTPEIIRTFALHVFTSHHMSHQLLQRWSQWITISLLRSFILAPTNSFIYRIKTSALSVYQSGFIGVLVSYLKLSLFLINHQDYLCKTFEHSHKVQT